MRSLATVMTSVMTSLFLAASLTACSSFSSVLPAKDPNPPKELQAIQATANIQTVWKVSTGSSDKAYVRIYPYVDETAVIVAGGGSASAWDKRKGTALWKTPISEEITGGVNGGEGLVFVGTSEGSAIALDRQTGKIRWIEHLNSEVLAVSAASKGRVVFRTGDGQLTGLSTQTGEIIWQQIRPSPELSLRGAGAPLIVGSAVIAGFDNGTVTAFDLEAGTGLWEAILSVPRGRNDLDKITDVDGRIKQVGSALFAASYNGQIAGIRLQDGALGWAQPYSSYAGVDADANGLYSTDVEGNVWKIHPQTGAPIWKMDDLQRRTPTAPTLMSDYIVVGDYAGYLHWINTRNGQTVARLQSDTAGYTVPPMSDGRVVYTFGKSGVLAAHALQ
ncbi:Beta-barrel assembly machine subunit BamB [Thiothrix eikelboomii]|uniref:Outer membrane protein assembly factor BamB n=1 Tax=Thiothrix eikelboomii TaxID=92487 RepID=A0A1T4WMP6_9GAMM|nr:outer membrane protein assembly factor BamB [Thiothrix eikelboomii]SKA78613.1 Beta-barrel assembly machine subunit BamB [Thiothrix eikelboomii]